MVDDAQIATARGPGSRESAAARPNAAIQYLGDAYDAARPKVMGRHSAGAGFLKGLVRHAGLETFYAFTSSRAEFDDFVRRIQSFGATGRAAKWVPPGRLSLLVEAGCLYLAGPGLAESAWERRFGDQRRYSLCGVTHTVSSARAMDALCNLLTAPTQSWDAMICTSRSVRAAVERLIEGHAAYLTERVGGTAWLPIQLPVIPLGVDCASFEPSAVRETRRESLRQRLGLGAEDVAFLFFGRLTFHAKAHPVPMFLAAELAQQALTTEPGMAGRRIHLLMVGQAPNEKIERDIRDAGPRYCPNVPLHILDGADPELADAAWSAGDVFISLSDNVQESFGLTPIEAMAAGLHTLVSDWNGYRDTTIDGQTGIRIATETPPAPAGFDFALHHGTGATTVDRYIGATSQATAVDVRAAADAIRRLAGSLELRRSLGVAGRHQAQHVYDWRVVIAQYQELWSELAQRRRIDQPIGATPASGKAPSPRPDPFDMFCGHATRQLDMNNAVRLADSQSLMRLENVLVQSMNTYAGQYFLPVDALRQLVQRIAKTAVSVTDMTQGLTPPERRTLMRTIAWLKKYDIVAF